MGENNGNRSRSGEPYVRVHKGYWHLYFRNPDPSKNYPLHRSLRLPESERDRAESIEAEARLIWRRRREELEEDPRRIEEVFEKFIQKKVGGEEGDADFAGESGPTLERVLEEFLESKKSKAKRTQEHYRSHAKQIRRLMSTNRPVQQVRPEDIREFLETRIEDEDLHKTTANKYITTFRTLFNFAQKRRYVETNPADLVDKYSLEPEDKEELSEPVYIPRDIYRTMIQSRAARDNPPIQPVMFLLYHTGMRIGELLRLRWRDVDLENDLIEVTATPQKGGDRKPYMVSRKLRLYFRFARREARKARGRNKWGTSKPFGKIAVIPNVNGDPLDYANLANNAWIPFMEQLEEEESEAYLRLRQEAEETDPDRRPVSFHDFRHTFITDLLVRGVNPVVVGWLVGHKELHTQSRYTHLCYQHFREEFEGFER